MPYVHPGPRSSSFLRALLPALAFGLIPLGTAFAEPPTATGYENLFVRVTRDEVDISSLRGRHEVRMHAPKGTVLEVFHIDGDRYERRDSNWYWVMLPEDQLGTRPVGWIRGDDVEIVPAPKPAAAHAANTAPSPGSTARGPSSAVVALERAPVERPVVEDTSASSTARSVRMPDVVLNFQFGRSDLTADAKSQLTTALTLPRATAQSVSVSLEGHADWVGTEPFNDRLGLARAETVRRYLSDQLQIPADRINVVSYGENVPAAPNTTREGRAQNRRVVIKVGA